MPTVRIRTFSSQANLKGMRKKLPKALLKYLPPISEEEEALFALAWSNFRYFIAGKGKDRISEERRHELTKEVLGDIFAIPESDWHRFTRPSQYKPDPLKKLRAMAKKYQEEMAKKAKHKKSHKPKPPKPKMTKLLIRRHSQATQGSKAITETIFIPAKPKV